jgi:hypothetical protein
VILMAHRIFFVLIGVMLALFVAGCGSDSSRTTEGPAASTTPQPAPTAAPSGKTHPQYCAHNLDPACAGGSYHGPFVALPYGGHWDANGKPVNGGPTGADGSTGNSLTQEYCAHNQDPACPIGSYVGPNAIKNPDGGPTYVVCEGTICTNPNHGAGGPPGIWGADGQPVNGGPTGADGSTGNNLSHEYCAHNQDPGCPAGSYVAPNAIKSPDGSNSYVPCEGTICTNPNYGAGDPSETDTTTDEVPPETDTTPGDGGGQTDDGAG